MNYNCLASTGSWLSGHAPIRKIALAFFSTLAVAGGLTSCMDDELIDMASQTDTTRTYANIQNEGGLIQQEDGTWKTQNCRFPMVGDGVIVSHIGGGLADVAGGENKVGNAVDLDLTNYTTTTVDIVSADIYTPIISIKDMNRTYAAEQKVGFVFKEEGGEALKLDALNGMTIQTSLKGKPQETIVAKGTDKNVLKLNVLAVAGGDKISDRELSFTAKKAFDEVSLFIYGVDAKVAKLGATKIKYAFVGENPEIRASKEEATFWENNWPTIQNNLHIVNEEYIVDDNNNTYAYTDHLHATSPYVTLNFGKSIPAGYQVGFCYSSSKLLGLTLLNKDGATLTAYGSDNKETGDKAEPKGELLGVSLLSGSERASICMDLKNPCQYLKVKTPGGLLSGLLGTMYYHYIYVRKPVELDPANYFSICCEDETYSTTYQLKKGNNGSVTYNILSQPSENEGKATIYKDREDNMVINMNKTGEYKVQAIYSHTETGKQIAYTLIIHKKVPQYSGECNIYLTTPVAEIGGAYSASGGITVLSGTSGLANIVDNNYDNYATYVGLLNLLEFKPIAAIDIKDKDKIQKFDSTRVGFEVQAATGLLDLSALKSYQIKVYNKGQEITSSSIAQTVNLGVLNFDNSRVRLSVDVAGEFDHIELWRKGVLNLLDAQKVYNVFYENNSCIEEGANEACMEVMSNATHNLKLNYNDTSLEGLGSILGSGLDNIENLLDKNINTAAVLHEGGGVANGLKVSLTFDEQKDNQPVGIVLGGNGDVVSADVLSWLSLEVFLGDNSITKITDFTTGDVNVIAKNGKQYLEINKGINQNYNRIDFTFGSGISILESKINLYGVYTRPDKDGDGIPDCAAKTINSSLVIDGNIQHICEENVAHLIVTNNKLTDNNVTLVVMNRESGETTETGKKIQTIIKTDNTIEIKDSDKLKVGRYYVNVMQGDNLLWNRAELYIHPKETTWEGKTTDWNAWENWTNGSPWNCTKVIIPSNKPHYPVLDKDQLNYCTNIHFEPGAQLENIPAFAESNPTGKIFIDTKLDEGKFHLFSAPLAGMVTGDMFVSNAIPNRFEPIDEGNYPEKRVSPVVYQRFWSKTVTRVENDGTSNNVVIDQTDWSKTFNAVATPYECGQGFSVRPGKEMDNSSNSYIFRFPKEHKTYHYFYTNGIATGQTENINRSSVGKFIKTDYTPIKLTIEKEGNRFLMGNPFMAYLDIKEFLVSNKDKVSAVQIYKNSQYHSITLSDDGQSLILPSGVSTTDIAPMEAMFIWTKAPATQLEVNINKEMFHQKGTASARLYRSLAVNRRVANNQLSLQAHMNGQSASCMVLQSQKASDGFQTDEDITLLMDNEEIPEICIYTVADKKALALQRMKLSNRIPVGIYVKNTGNVTLVFANVGSSWNRWKLLDKVTGKSYSLQERIELQNVSSSADRFELVKE